MGIEQLENKGFAFINSGNINTKTRQIIVIGSARGGTSLVAGALHHLGVFTGEKSHPPVFEDVLLSEAFEADDLNKASEIVEKYNSIHNIWAWKRPGALNYLKKVEKVIPNPFYIFIFKDIFSIANRNNISMQADISKSLQNALADYSKIVDFVSSTDKPVMLVSAEKALQNKESFVNALIELNKNIIDLSEKKQKAIDFITPNPKDYLDSTRITKAKGVVDLVDTRGIHGWAMALHHKNPVEIELLADGEVIATTKANLYRKDLLGNNLHPTGQCGFFFKLTPQLIQLECESIDLKVKGDIYPLKKGKGIKLNF